MKRVAKERARLTNSERNAAPQYFCNSLLSTLKIAGTGGFFKIILDGISFYSKIFHSYFVMKSILLPLRKTRNDPSFEETGLQRLDEKIGGVVGRKGNIFIHNRWLVTFRLLLTFLFESSQLWI